MTPLVAMVVVVVFILRSSRYVWRIDLTRITPEQPSRPIFATFVQMAVTLIFTSRLCPNTTEHSHHQLKFGFPRSIGLVTLAFITWWRPREPNRNVVENKLQLVHWLIVVFSVNQVPAGKVGWCHQVFFFFFFFFLQVKRRSVEYKVYLTVNDINAPNRFEETEGQRTKANSKASFLIF